MPGSRAPRPWGFTALRDHVVQGAALPGCTGATPFDDPRQRPAEPADASHGLTRLRTDRDLLRLAASVPLNPTKDRAVFYAETSGARLASEFVAANPGFERLDELVPRTFEGAVLWARLAWHSRPWSDQEEVWWELSRRLAQAAHGIVNVFGPRRLLEDRPASEFKHRYGVVVGGRLRPAYANTVFEKVELPELEQNPTVTAIYYNGEPFGAEH